MLNLDFCTLHDKSDWPEGPWKDEPDRVAWTDVVHGLPCLVRRTPRGNWCGYVAVRSNHPLYRVAYNQCYKSRSSRCADTGHEWCYHRPETLVNVHGGLTYSDTCMGDPETGICHIGDKDDHVWWFGWDAAHWGDYVPCLHLPQAPEEEYRTLRYAIEETGRLARDLGLMLL